MNIDHILQIAHAHRNQEEWSKACYLYKQCLANHPRSADLHHNYGLCLFGLNQISDATQHLQLARTINPNLWQSDLILARIYLKKKDYLNAEHCFNNVLKVQPSHPESLIEKSHLLMNIFGCPEQARHCIEPLLDHPTHGAEAKLTTILSKLYDRNESAQEINQEIILFSKAHLNILNWPHAKRSPRTLSQFTHRRPRVAFISPLLCLGPVYFMTVFAWEKIAKECEIVVFNRSSKVDEASHHLRSLSHEWYQVEDMNATMLANCIYDSDIDVLYDLGGWMDPVCITALSVKPARIQYKWVGGQSITTGSDAFDGWIGDEFQSPMHLQYLYTEKLINIAPHYANYTPPKYMPKPAGVKSKDPIIFSNPSKLSAQFLTDLSKLPGKKVFLHKHFKFPHIQNRIQEFLKPSEFELITPNSHLETLQALNQHSTMIDTYPYSSGLTGREATALGLKIVSQPGLLFCERHCAHHVRS